MASPLSRSIEILKKEGFITQKVEHWNYFAKIRQDFCNFGDLIAFRPGAGTYAINATTHTNLSAHLSKYKNNEKLKKWLESGNFFEIWSWAKRGKKGKRKTWELKKVPISLDFFS